MKNVIVNAMPDDTFIAVKAQYNHTSIANVIRGGVLQINGNFRNPGRFPFRQN